MENKPSEPSVVTPSKRSVPHEVQTYDAQQEPMSQLTGFEIGNESASASVNFFSNDFIDLFQTNKSYENPSTLSEEPSSTGRGHPQMSQTVLYEHILQLKAELDMKNAIIEQQGKQHKTESEMKDAIIEQQGKHINDLEKREGRSTKALIKANKLLKPSDVQYIKTTVKTVFFKTTKFLPKEWASAAQQNMKRIKDLEETKLIFKALKVNENVFEGNRWMEVVKLIKTEVSKKSKSIKCAIKKRYNGK